MTENYETHMSVRALCCMAVRISHTVSDQSPIYITARKTTKHVENA